MSRTKEPRVLVMPEWITMIEPLKDTNPQGWYELFSGCTKEALRMIDKFKTDDPEIQELYRKTRILHVTEKRRAGKITVDKNYLRYGKKTNNDIA